MTDGALALDILGYRLPHQRSATRGPLLQRLAAGDPSAWDETTRRYAGLLHGIAFSCGLPAPEADDVAQRVWIALLEKAGGIRDQEALTTWLTTTTRREAWRVARARGREIPTDDVLGAVQPGAGVAPPDEAEAAVDRIVEDERAAALRAAIGTLPRRQRELALLLLADDVTYEEICARTGMPVGSIGPTRGRVLSRLRQLLEGERAFAPADA
jgi:RNA polymerase sigma factor (sigma-70 family)